MMRGLLLDLPGIYLETATCWETDGIECLAARSSSLFPPSFRLRGGGEDKKKLKLDTGREQLDEAAFFWHQKSLREKDRNATSSGCFFFFPAYTYVWIRQLQARAEQRPPLNCHFLSRVSARNSTHFCKTRNCAVGKEEVEKKPSFSPLLPPFPFLPLTFPQNLSSEDVWRTINPA